MVIRNINKLAQYYKTDRIHLDSVMSNRARLDISVDVLPTQIRVSTFVGACNTEFCIVCHFPFESSAVDVFLDTIEHTCSAAYDEAFDDPVEMLMNMTEPGMEMTQDKALTILAQAEANGWHIDPRLEWSDIVSIYKDLEPEEEDN